MTSKALHIVSFTVPFPANYGGAIDVFYKLKALYEQGVEITLHCFQYDRKEAPELLKYCKQVHYYQRKKSLSLFFNTQPYIVATRRSDDLITNLLKNNEPILLEGVHSCGIIGDVRFNNRKIIIRSHNIEHHYYEHLALSERNWFKKIYFVTESKKLKKFEAVNFPLATEIWGISDKDTVYLQKNYRKGIKVSAFHQFSELKIDLSSEPYAFYHGNLAIGENIQAAMYLIDDIFSKTTHKLIIAGNNPPKELINLCSQYSNIELMANISSDEIFSLLGKAQMNVLPTFQSTGIKLKLLAALYRGKHCIVSPCMVEGTGLEEVCWVGKDSPSFLKLVEEKFQEDFTAEELKKRADLLKEFSNERNAEKAIQSIF